MRSTCILALTAGFIAPIFAAATPACAPNADGYQVEKLAYLYNDFCNQLQAGGFASKQKLYDQPVVSLTFTLAAVKECSLADCVKSYQSLVSTCGQADHSIRGNSNVPSACGLYAFAVLPASGTSSLGQPAATLIAATIKTINPATLTSSSYPTTTSISTTSSASPTSYSISSISSHESLTETSLSYSAGPLFANATSTVGNITVVATGGASYLPSAASTPAAGTPTKPLVGSTALGNGAGMVQASGLAMVGVACVFGLLL